MKVFISHIHEEAILAQVLKEWIESTFIGQLEVFVSSDIKNIPAGSKWLTEIDSALNSSSLFILLCSRLSLTRPWINFEAGCAWIKKVPLMPVCHSGVSKNNLPNPLSIFQAIELDSDKFVEDLFESLKVHFKFSKLPRIDKNAMMLELQTAIKAIMNVSPSMIESKTERVEGVSDEDALNIIESWLGARPGTDNKRTMKFSEVDDELKLPVGTAKRMLEQAAIRWNYMVRRKGEDTILFEDAPLRAPQNNFGDYRF